MPQNGMKCCLDKGTIDMEYFKTVTLKDGRKCIIRNGTAQDGQAALDNFNLAHAQTDFLMSYPDEKRFTVEQEAQFLKEKAESDNEIELLAELDGEIVGMAGLACLGTREKIRHRASFGISIDRAYWGLGIGRALTEACIACAKNAGYAQLELDVVAENERAIALYRSLGFKEYGCNPRGFRSRQGCWQALLLMRLELTEDI